MKLRILAGLVVFCLATLALAHGFTRQRLELTKEPLPLPDAGPPKLPCGEPRALARVGETPYPSFSTDLAPTRAFIDRNGELCRKRGGTAVYAGDVAPFSCWTIACRNGFCGEGSLLYEVEFR